jgi:hypothetical protein
LSAGSPSAAGAAARAGWHAVDAGGRDPATGRPPHGPGAPSAAAALARVPVARWPVRACTGGGAISVGAALGPGGTRVERLLDRLAAPPAPPAGRALAALARATPAGPLDLAVAVVDLGGGVAAAGAVDRAWMGLLEARRQTPRAALEAHGRSHELEAALNLAMLLGTEGVLVGDDDEAARVASGARLWLLAGAVAWALLDDADDPFAAWGELVSYGLWPVGPVDGRLVVCTP